MKTLKFILLVLFISAGSLHAQELSIKVSSEPIKMKIGESAQIQALVIDANGKKVPNREYIFYSRNSRTLSVDQSTGMATAIKHGEYSIVVISPNAEEGR